MSDAVVKAIALAERLQTTHVTSDSHAAEVIDDLVAGVIAMESSIKTLLENNAQLTKTVVEMPEWERAVKAASTQERANLAKALREAIDLLVELNNTASAAGLTRDEVDANCTRIEEWERLLKE